MPNVLFEIPFEPRYHAQSSQDPTLKAEMDSVDTNHGEIDAVNGRLKLYIPIKTFRAFYPNLLRSLWIHFSKAAAAKWEQPAYKAYRDQKLRAARDNLREPPFQYPQADATAGCGLNGTESTDAASSHLLGANQGSVSGMRMMIRTRALCSSRRWISPAPTNLRSCSSKNFRSSCKTRSMRI